MSAETLSACISSGTVLPRFLLWNGTVRAKEGVVGEKGRKLGRNREKIVEGAREKI
jgi:hypothetical protein